MRVAAEMGKHLLVSAKRLLGMEVVNTAPRWATAKTDQMVISTRANFLDSKWWEIIRHRVLKIYH